MPELAEVEWYRKQWNAGLGQRIVALQLHAQKRIFRGADARALRQNLLGARFLRSSARGKRMLFQFSGDNWLGIHLGMTGKIHVADNSFRAGRHDHLVLGQRQRTLVLTDARQFGRVRFHHGRNEPAWWKSAAPEIIAPAFNQKFVAHFLERHRNAPIKAVLLMQHGFSGIGNWMADEILWRARIHPGTRADKLDAAKGAALVRATKSIVRTSLRTIGQDYSDPPSTWLIHQRWKRGGFCPRHRIALKRATIGGRTTAWCPQCQKLN